jgi:xanthine dehydrogenase molybdenum-binding subunit
MIAVAPAIANAIYNAVGIRLKDLPLNPERVLQALRGRKGSVGGNGHENRRVE